MTLNKIASIRLLCLLLIAGGSLPASAQSDSALAGRIVHVYLPSDDVDSLILRNWSVPTKRTGRFWYTVTLLGDKFNSNQGFFFATPQANRFITRMGLGNSEAASGRFTVEDFQGKHEMWIVVDPSGPITAAPYVLLEPPKIINVLNPWAATGPRIALPDGTFRTMSARPDRCGWFMAFLPKPTGMNLHFREIDGTETYGAGGRGTTTSYDMAARFSAQGVADTLGMELWLDTETNAWSPAYPGKDGLCRYLLAGTVRDFSAAHPDFSFGALTGNHLLAGVVLPTLGPGRKPMINPAQIGQDPAISFSQFDKWWVTDSTNADPALRSHESCHDIPMGKTGDGGWEYDSFRDSPDHSFYPVQEGNRNPEEELAVCYFNHSEPPVFMGNLAGQKRNGNFCMESHAAFTYRKGQRIEFRGDDDVWMFIDGKLVMELGGVHIPARDTVDLDLLDLTEGREYKWDFFYCDRQPCGSALHLKTSILFKQPRPLEAVEEPGKPGIFKIVKRVGGQGSCAGQGDTLKVVPAVNLTYQLRDAAGQVVATLGNGAFYAGGIVIATAPPAIEPTVAVDTAKAASGLAPGNYRIVAFDPANASVRAEIPFTISPGSTALRRGAKTGLRARPKPVHDALGRAREAGPRKVFRKP